MGCDIHMYVEKRVNGRWEHVPPPSAFGWGDLDSTLVDGSWDLGRNYALFTVLSGVRNDHCENKPIKQCPHTLPSDISKLVADRSEEGGYHSHSSYTLAELLNHDWDTPFYEIGVVTKEEAIRLKNGEYPTFLKRWCGWVAGPGIKVMPWVCAEDRTVEDLEKDVEYTHVEMVWTNKQSESMQHFVDQFIPALLEIGDLEDVRCVFFYDC